MPNNLANRMECDGDGWLTQDDGHWFPTQLDAAYHVGMLDGLGFAITNAVEALERLGRTKDDVVAVLRSIRLADDDAVDALLRTDHRHIAEALTQGHPQQTHQG